MTRRSHWLIDWGGLQWYWAGSFDAYKFVAWLIVPLALCARRLDVSYFSFTRWKRPEWAVLGVAVLGGILLMAALPNIPGVGDYYHGWGHLSPHDRRAQALGSLLWTLSWLPGWEFIHRYFLLRPLRAASNRAGIVLVLIVIPIVEGGYHIFQQKPALECAGMAALSALMCGYVLARRNVLLPFLVHFIIEVELVAYLYVN
ncbi:MAG: hypothetical protein AAB353_13185 [Candidatus Hydrogenedentota bacterium]